MKQNIIIIGAGLSGLYLAFRLQRRYNITILEARDRLGGRIHNCDGHDMGPSWVWQHHTQILSLLQELDLKVFGQYTHGDALYDTANTLERFTPPPSAPSGRIEGSLTSLIQALQKQLKHTSIHLSEEVVSVKESTQSVSVQSKTNTYAANYVISTLPPRLASKLVYEPTLPQALLSTLQSTQTWMGNTAKCVLEFESDFWRKEGLSGFVFSNIGPLGEIHDASTSDKAALFGFLNSHTSIETFEEDVRTQMKRVFKSTASHIKAIYLVSWRKEPFTSTSQDSLPLSVHPNYGIDTTDYSQRILFSATEFSHKEGGYLEGAIMRANVISSVLLAKV
ncbi:MAG: hypothetical protein DRQ78_03190 [Epsilonproteobacteria bacterium]|nr:MAG: hypothetical protein DRQ78_03190 [Campylobacterota bacterium]